MSWLRRYFVVDRHDDRQDEESRPLKFTDFIDADEFIRLEIQRHKSDPAYRCSAHDDRD